MTSTAAPNQDAITGGEFVALSCFTVANGMDEAVRAAFRSRPHHVDDVEGFLRMEVIQPVTDASEFWLMTFWTDEACFKRWHHSHLYKDSHAGIPKGLKLVRGSTQIRYFNHVCS